MLAPRAQQIADRIMEAEHTVPLDRFAAEQIGSLLTLLKTPPA